MAAMETAAKPKRGRVCSICSDRRAALKRPKTLEQVNFSVILHFLFDSLLQNNIFLFLSVIDLQGVFLRSLRGRDSQSDCG